MKGVSLTLEKPSSLTNITAHDVGFARMFTGAQLLDVAGAPWGGAASVDQILAKAWGVDSLALAVLTSKGQPSPKPGFSHRESFSYLGPATLKHPRRDPLSVFHHLFPSASPDAARRASVLDAVAANLAEVSQRLGPSERAKLDYHLTAIRDVEQGLAAKAPTCAVPPPPTDYLAKGAKYEVSDESLLPAIVDDMIDLAALGLTCGVTRIATLQLGYGGGIWNFAWEGIDMDCHADVAHKDTSNEGSSPENTDRVVRMNQYYARCVARLATRLDAVPEGDGTMLDNTLVVWANEQARGDHDMNDLPIVLIGGAGGALPAGGRLVQAGPQPFQRLGCTILNAMGVPSPGFGEGPDGLPFECGTFAGV